VILADYLSDTGNYLTALPAPGSSTNAAAAPGSALGKRTDARPDLWLIFVVSHAVVGGALLIGAGVAWLVRRRREAADGVYEKNTIPIEVLRTQPLNF
jgi:MYXO-CTERM domain-containing protein